LNGLGEKKLTKAESTVTIEREQFFRREDENVGLVNLGATCYINAYLQVNLTLPHHTPKVPLILTLLFTLDKGLVQQRIFS
jgi:uncharacterized UBP type Zn finger protein